MSDVMEISLNQVTWYTDREIFYCPAHFVKASTKMTPESMEWIYEKLYGRFYIGHRVDVDAEVIHTPTGNVVAVPYFEDPQEAIYYELVWS